MKKIILFLSAGLFIPLKKVDNLLFRAKLGYSYSLIRESFNNINSNSYGLTFGFGVERKIIRHFRIYFDLSYNFQKTKKSEFRHFDMTKLSVGFIF